MTDTIKRAREVLAKADSWSLLRNVLSQGRAIQMDYAAGKYQHHEHLSARLDEAARERMDDPAIAIARRIAGPLLDVLEDEVARGSFVRGSSVSRALAAIDKALEKVK